MAFTYARHRAPHKARANNEKLKFARNEHKNERFCAYENVDETVKYSVPLFLLFLQNYAIIAIKNDFVIHSNTPRLYSQW